MFKIEFAKLMERYKFVLDLKNQRYEKYPLRFLETKTTITVYLKDSDGEIVYSIVNKSSIEASGITIEEWKTNNFQTSLGAYEIIKRTK